ncbi:MAG: hypothetical protein N2645_08175 [Clostridia bacterium]|nr:hypothetical protein [Clostridia bacterium]
MLEENPLLSTNEGLNAPTPAPPFNQKNRVKSIHYVLSVIFSLLAFSVLLFFDALRAPLLETTLKAYLPKSLIFTLVIPLLTFLILFFVFRRSRHVAFLILSILYVFAALTSCGIYIKQYMEDTKKHRAAYDELDSLLKAYSSAQDIPLKIYSKGKYGRYLVLLTTYKDYIEDDSQTERELKKIFNQETNHWQNFIDDDNHKGKEFIKLLSLRVSGLDNAINSMDKLEEKRAKRTDQFKKDAQKLAYKKDMEDNIFKEINSKKSKMQKQKIVLKEYKTAYTGIKTYKENDAKYLDQIKKKYGAFWADYDLLKAISTSDKINHTILFIDEFLRDNKKTYENRVNNIKTAIKQISSLKNTEHKEVLIDALKINERLFLTKHKEFSKQEEIIANVAKQTLVYLKENRKKYYVGGNEILFYTMAELNKYNNFVNKKLKELNLAESKKDQIQKDLKKAVSDFFDPTIPDFSL